MDRVPAFKLGWCGFESHWCYPVVGKRGCTLFLYFLALAGHCSVVGNKYKELLGSFLK